MTDLPAWLSGILSRADHRLIDGRYPSFSSGRCVWDQLSDDQYRELFEAAKHLPWDQALRQVMLKHWSKYLADYNTSPARYAFIDPLLPKASDLTALDIGCGLGNISQALARRYERVVAVDLPDNIIRWLNLLKQNAALDGLEAVGIENLDLSSLPFKDNSFDLVVLGMTLQWIGSFDLSHSPDKVQKKVLSDIFRVIKPGGRLVFFDRNRYMYNYFLGEPDGSAVKYASLLPRWLADLKTWFERTFSRSGRKYYQYVAEASLKHKRYRNYKHTYTYLMRLFWELGFKNSSAYIAVPNVKFQKIFISLADEVEAERLFGQGFLKTVLRSVKGHWLGKRLLQLLILLRLSRFLADGYIIIAEK
ncbi:MAG: class I SAM-dependent methyltransferase [Candidatus Saganbacteria bacterium]|nr:class I SAM-dependent methyltransferase [Candidatus Saganbacteria bacterium]